MCTGVATLGISSNVSPGAQAVGSISSFSSEATEMVPSVEVGSSAWSEREQVPSLDRAWSRAQSAGPWRETLLTASTFARKGPGH